MHITSSEPNIAKLQQTDYSNKTVQYYVGVR